jgi:hypothetical protein
MLDLLAFYDFLNICYAIRTKNNTNETQTKFFDFKFLGL